VGPEEDKLYYKIINKRKKVLTIFADLLGYAFWGPIRYLSGKKDRTLKDLRKILVIRTAYVGDVVMTLPILSALKRSYPGSKITFLTNSGALELLKHNPYVDELLAYDPFWFYPAGKGRALRDYLVFLNKLRKARYDLVIEARGDVRDIALLAYASRSTFRMSYGVGGGGFLLTHIVPYEGLKHKVRYHLDLAGYLGCDTAVADGGIYLTDDELAKVDELIDRHGINRSFIAVHPGSRLSLKRWAADKYAMLCDRLMKEHQRQLVILGSRAEKPLVDDVLRKTDRNALTLAGKLGLRELAGVISRSDLLICNDSAPMHIAAAMKTPTVAIFGPSKSVETAPYGTLHKVVEKDFKCRHNCDESTCYNKHVQFNACMEDITVEDVFSAVEEVLKEFGQ
jgi:predicted lipopolysaccharide heptosyltransferase III